MHAIASDWRQAGLSLADEALCTFAEKLTRTPQTMTEADITSLRSHGYDDRAIHDATQVISYFNYINRMADALDVDYEDFIRPWEQSAAAPLSTQDGEQRQGNGHGVFDDGDTAV